MIAPEAPQAPANAMSYTIFAAIVVVGLFVSYKGYSLEAPRRHTSKDDRLLAMHRRPDFHAAMTAVGRKPVVRLLMSVFAPPNG